MSDNANVPAPPQHVAASTPLNVARTFQNALTPSAISTPFQWGQIASIDANFTLSVYLDGSSTATVGIRYTSDYIPKVGDVVQVYRGTSGKTDRVVRGPLASGTQTTSLSVFGTGATFLGSAPAISAGRFLMQTATIVVTPNGSGLATISYPVAFPTGVIAPVFCNGDGGNAPAQLTSAAPGSGNTLSSITTKNVDSRNANVITTPIRINYVVIGF